MPGQAHVEDDEVRRLARRDLEALFTRSGDGDLVALLLQGVLDAASDRVLVFDDENGGCHGRMLHRRAANAPGASRIRAGGARDGSSAESWYPIGRYRAPRHSGPAGEPQPASRPRSIQRFHHMPTARATLAAEHRELTGKKVARLRHAGRLPAVVYGHGVASDSISVDAHEFEQLRRHTGPNALVDLSVDGGKAQPVLVSAVQVHPVNRRALHVDLFLVRMTEELTVDVPLVATGDSPAIADLGGTLLHPIESVRIRALPDHLPQAIEYSIESLVDFDTTIHVRDLVIPDDVTLMTDGDEIVAKVQAPRVEEAPVVAEVEIGEGAPEEGEAESRRPARASAAAPTRADRTRVGRQRERRPDANTIEKRIVIRSAERRPRRRRSVPISRLRTSRLHLVEQRLLVELAHERDEVVDAERVLQAPES